MGGWWDRAACKGVDTNVFFPGDDSQGSYWEARQYCGTCPVAAQCAQDSIRGGVAFGMFGGLTPRERGFSRSGLTFRPPRTDGHGDKPGTVTGYYRERAQGKPVCAACRKAYNRYSADRSRRRRNARITSNAS